MFELNVAILIADFSVIHYEFLELSANIRLDTEGEVSIG